jgi:hypothetical protein
MNPFLAGAMGLGSIFSGLFGAVTSSEASQAQQDAIKAATEQLHGYLTQSLGYQQPIYQQGMKNLADVNAGMQSGSYNVAPYSYQAQPFNYEQSPGYQFAVNQGQGAINANAARMGTQLSSGNLKNLASYTTGMANQDYGNQWNRYMQGQQFNAGNQWNAYQSQNEQANQRFGRGMTLAGTGINAANNMGQLTSNYGTNIAELMGQGGTARASGIMGQGQQIGGMFQNLGNIGMLYGLTREPKEPTTLGQAPLPGGRV